VKHDVIILGGLIQKTSSVKSHSGARRFRLVAYDGIGANFQMDLPERLKNLVKSF
jgi:hypothetical protein